MTELELRRRGKQYTQQNMADEINVSVGCYNMYENNQRKIPIEKAEKIANVLECKMEDIFTPFSFTVSEIAAKEVEN